MMRGIYKIVLFVYFNSVFLCSFGEIKRFPAGLEQVIIDGDQSPFNAVMPGDTIVFNPGVRKCLLIKNFCGEPDRPIVMINGKGEVIIDTDHYFGISIENCRYFQITGTGDSSLQYGIRVQKVLEGAGVGVGRLSSNYEIDHLSISNCKLAGLYAKTDPDCTSFTGREQFTQFNTSIHDNYISAVGLEGMYIGSTKYFGQTIYCAGKDTLVFPSLLDGVRVYNNIIENTGWDGIQVSGAYRDCEIFGNQIFNDSQAEYPSQMSGIIIGGGSKCDCYNNHIENGKGDGIEIHGLGGSKIYNNIIIDAGQNFMEEDPSRMIHGIFVTDVSIMKDSSFYFLHNTIVNPKSDGIRFQSVYSRSNLIASNVIINPGNYSYYEASNTSFQGADAYVALPNKDSDITLKNNFFDLDLETAGLTEDYKILPMSPLIDTGYSGWPHINFDFGGSPRNVDAAPDIGAYEFQVDHDDGDEIDFPFQYRLMNDNHYPVLMIEIVDDIQLPVRIEIYNVMGIRIFQEEFGLLARGKYEFELNVSRPSSGIFIVRLKGGKYISVKKFVVV